MAGNYFVEEDGHDDNLEWLTTDISTLPEWMQTILDGELSFGKAKAKLITKTVCPEDDGCEGWQFPKVHN